MRTLLLLTLLFSFVSVASAGTIYQVTVDTTTISGTAGSLDFQFNPGPLVSQAASLYIFSFASNGTLVAGACLAGGPCLTGNVTGTLPGTVTFDNGTGFNDYFQGFTFASNLIFSVKLYGPAVDSPDGTSTSGSTFAFSMFSDAAGTVPVLTSDLTNGFAATIEVNLDGTTTVSNFSAQTNISAEPSSVVLIGTAALALVLLRLKRPRFT